MLFWQSPLLIELNYKKYMNESRLTKYTPGGVMELFTISWPVMLSTMMGCLMTLVDRIILGHYSPAAFKACYGAAQWYWTFYIVAVEFVSVTEIFVGQYNGAQRFREIGSVVWQMIWFSLGSYLLLIPITSWVLPYLLADDIVELGVPYLKILMWFIPIVCIGNGVLCAFFTGCGKNKMIPVVTVLSVLLNIILDFPLIFGCRITPFGNFEIIPGHGFSISWITNISDLTIIPELGIVGAAMATVISQIMSMLFFSTLFFKRSNRERYATTNMAFDFKLLKKCLKVSIPNALSHFIVFLFFAIMVQVIIRYCSKENSDAFAVSNTIESMFFPITMGMMIGTRTVCANAIGAHKLEIVSKNIRSWMILGAIFVLLVALVISIYPNQIIGMFLGKETNHDTFTMAQNMLVWMCFVFILDILFSNLQGTLLASGDTKFIMLVNTFSVICCWIVPTYCGIVFWKWGSITHWRFLMLDLTMRIIFFTFRFRSGRWKKHQLI
jgi:MATE family multidrug resistance protein